jgi:hypothetical protein
MTLIAGQCFTMMCARHVNNKLDMKGDGVRAMSLKVMRHMEI